MMFKSINTCIACKAIFKINLKSLFIAFVLFGAESKCISQKKANELLHQTDLTVNKGLNHIATNEGSSSSEDNDHQVSTRIVKEENHSLYGEVVCFRTPDGKFMNLLKVHNQQKSEKRFLFAFAKEITSLSMIKFSNNTAELFDNNHHSLGSAEIFLEIHNDLLPFLPFLSQESGSFKSVKLASMTDTAIPIILNDTYNAVSVAKIKNAPCSNKVSLQAIVDHAKLGTIQKAGFILAKPGVVTNLIENIVTQSIKLSNEMVTSDDYVIHATSFVRDEITLSLPYVDSAYTAGFLYMSSGNRVYVVPLKSVTDVITEERPPVEEKKDTDTPLQDDEEQDKNNLVGDGDQTDSSNMEVLDGINDIALEIIITQIEKNKQDNVQETPIVETLTGDTNNDDVSEIEDNEKASKEDIKRVAEKIVDEITKYAEEAKEYAEEVRKKIDEDEDDKNDVSNSAEELVGFAKKVVTEITTESKKIADENQLENLKEVAEKYKVSLGMQKILLSRRQASV
ncbi:hypothetical protein [Cardinium endosymbiont of Tipula unca]|uniref:hypothetical protein n=1 Tax=Cardinium endosymbiont of Tipula unca TaxID=3066216 RepID=UPI0030D4A087